MKTILAPSPTLTTETKTVPRHRLCALAFLSTLPLACGEPDRGATASPLETKELSTCPKDTTFCDDVDHVPELRKDLTFLALKASDLTPANEQVVFENGNRTSWKVRIVLDAGDDSVNKSRGAIDLASRGNEVRVVTNLRLPKVVQSYSPLAHEISIKSPLSKRSSLGSAKANSRRSPLRGSKYSTRSPKEWSPTMGSTLASSRHHRIVSSRRWSTTTQIIDDAAEIRHLATYVASDGDGCWHRNKALQAIEPYIQMAMRIGEGVVDGELVNWPELAPPTPQPPTCVGTEGCLCTEVPNHPDYGPDGNDSIESYCDDNDGESTCVRTQINAGAIVGVCTKCDPVRGPGCECDTQRECAVGACWGEDTWGGGTGHCYDNNPPSWVCLADCERLFNDAYAECANNHLGGARCLDGGCPQYLSEECYAQGMVCRDGECVVECASAADCSDLGYPNSFECIGNRCEYPF